MAVDDDALRRAKRMRALIRELAPMPRLLNSPGLDQAFGMLKREEPDFMIHEYPVGMECDDWIVPPSWRLVFGIMEDESGVVVASSEECPLFVAPCSEGVDGWFTKEEIAGHLRTRPDRPDAFALEHRNAYDYSRRTWGITLPHNRWTALPEDGKYHLRIEVEWGQGSMKAAEWLLPGRREEIICLNGHIDELCNDDLSGCVVGLELMRALAELPERTYSYQLLLTPEMFGTLFFIHRNMDRVARTVGHLNLETMGAGMGWILKTSKAGDGLQERVMRQALAEVGLEYGEMGFFEAYGNDERIYEWPTIGVPGISLQRYPFEQYHTSDDTPDIISEQYLAEAFAASMAYIQMLELNAVPRFTTLLQPWLTRRGLYFDRENPEQWEAFQKFNNTVLQHVDGQLNILDLAELSGLTMRDVRRFLDSLEAEGLVEYLDVQAQAFGRMPQREDF